MIICKACNISKSEDEFFNNSVKSNGKDSKCKACRRIKNKEWVENNFARLQESRKDYYEENKEYILSKKHEYYRKNSEKLLKQKSEYWHKNKNAIKERVRIWRNTNRSTLLDKGKQNRSFTVKAVLDLLGPSCKSCDEKEIEFLTVDHKNNTGNTERKMRPALGWKRDILTGKCDISQYQVLCHNCNHVKYNQNPVHQLKNAILTGIVKKCIHCESLKDLSEFKSQDSNDKSICLECARNRRKRINNERKKILGLECRCCGISDLSFLVVDHVNSNGNELRRKGQRTGEGLLYEATLGGVANPEYQLLCYNCNYSKHIGNGICVHKRTNKNKLHKASNKPKVSEKIDLIDFSFYDVEIHNVANADDSRKFLNLYHYAGYGRGAVCVYEIRLHGELVGVLKFTYPIRQGIAATLNVSSKELLELDRFCIHPARHKKNFASYIMSRVIRLLTESHPHIKKLVSFADPRFGHNGGIYKASNWLYHGTTTPSYYYEDQLGNEINKKTLYNSARTRNMKERDYFESLGLRKIRIPAKHKFSYNL